MSYCPFLKSLVLLRFHFAVFLVLFFPFLKDFDELEDESESEELEDDPDEDSAAELEAELLDELDARDNANRLRFLFLPGTKSSSSSVPEKSFPSELSCSSSKYFE